jgi:hypothetical protein
MVATCDFSFILSITAVEQKRNILGTASSPEVRERAEKDGQHADVVMENFRKFSQVETFPKVSGNFPYDVRASFFTCLFFYHIIYIL